MSAKVNPIIVESVTASSAGSGILSAPPIDELTGENS